MGGEWGLGRGRLGGRGTVEIRSVDGKGGYSAGSCDTGAHHQPADPGNGNSEELCSNAGKRECGERALKTTRWGPATGPRTAPTSPGAKWRPHAAQRLGHQTDRWNGGAVPERCRKGREGGKPGDLGKNHKTEARAGHHEECGILNQSAGVARNSAPFNTKTHQKGAAESCHLTSVAGR